jgi:hypothetical protein
MDKNILIIKIFSIVIGIFSFKTTQVKYTFFNQFIKSYIYTRMDSHEFKEK